MVLITVEREWFVTGGTVLKNEARTEAVHCVTEEELGVSVIIDDYISTYECFYDTSEIEDLDPKHNVATTYRCQFEHVDSDCSGGDQHSMLDVPVHRTRVFIRTLNGILTISKNNTSILRISITKTPPRNSEKVLWKYINQQDLNLIPMCWLTPLCTKTKEFS